MAISSTPGHASHPKVTHPKPTGPIPIGKPIHAKTRLAVPCTGRTEEPSTPSPSTGTNSSTSS